MNKSELVAKLAEKNPSLSKAAVANVLNSFLETVKETTSAGEPVILVGFGTFQQKERAPRTGRNPSTGEVIHIPAAKVVDCKLSSTWARQEVAAPKKKGK